MGTLAKYGTHLMKKLKDPGPSPRQGSQAPARNSIAPAVTKLGGPQKSPKGPPPEMEGLFADLASKIEKMGDNNNKKIDQLKEAHEKQIENLKQATISKVDKLEESHSSLVSNLREENTRVITEIREEHKMQLYNLEQKIDDMRF
mmetsp:Transcript_10405/g.15991  ORF Transcript_10405/g.15991 Transcript_10405/m.15991 type:complete len:145 (+) Transcript_10405:337-771(+)